MFAGAGNAFFGYVNGARAALKQFKTQGSGTLINVDSIEGAAPKPYNSAYSAAKHAVRALASSLRMELALDDIAKTQTMLMTAEDFREFHAGFTGKRKPDYRGS